MDETANHSGDLFTKDAHSCGRNLKKSFEKILIMNTFYVRLSLTWVLLFQGPLLKYHEGTQNSCGKTKGAFQVSQNWPAGPWLDPPDILAMKLFFFLKVLLKNHFLCA